MHNQELLIINQIYLKCQKEESLHKQVLRELQTKLNGYLNQDKKKDLIDINLITIDELLEKLVISKLKCLYCKEPVRILYKTQKSKQDNEYIHIRDRKSNCEEFNSNSIKIVSTEKINSSKDFKQWTLDRINNNLEHSNENTVVACLKCNLERRRINKLAFQFTKNLHIKKLL